MPTRYAAVYRSLVPSIELKYPLHFGLCAASDTNAPSPSATRMARITLRDASQPHHVAADAEGDPYYTVHTAPDGTALSHDATPPAIGARLRTGQYYTAYVCLDLPESPANIGAGTSKAPCLESEVGI